ncbi:MAG: NADH-quinone oxidoreductase subunit M [Planctomycetes bacterium]|nr:NADH-quinone oxidoreductase subunit M [Planctomycetota bacterium]
MVSYLTNLVEGILTAIILTPLIGAILLMLPPRGDDRSVRRSALAFSLIPLVLSLIAVYFFYWKSPPAGAASNYRFLQEVPWIVGGAAHDRTIASAENPGGLNIAFRVGVDAISLWLLVLTALLTPLAIWSGFTAVRERVREYHVCMLLLEAALLGVFCSLDLLLFYVFFEFTLIPLFLLIGIWGGHERRRAAMKFFIFTLTGSVFTLAGVIYLAYYTYSVLGFVNLDIRALIVMGQSGAIPFHVQWWLFLAFAAGFAIKVPLFPLHTWLPLAHTEAPTAGSVILAGVLLKLGTYGFCRLAIPMFPDAARHWAPAVGVLAVIGIIYTALCAWVQRDVKKLVAYSSVSHLGFCMLGLFSLKVIGVTAGVFYMVNHGLSTGALFLLVGFIYERYHTRDIHAIGGLAKPMPWLAFFLVFFTLSSIGLPMLNGFVGEFLVLVGTATSQSVSDGRPAGPLGLSYVVPAATGIILGAVYMLWMCQRVLFGPLTEPPHTPDTSTGLPRDLGRREIAILTALAICCLFLGLFPAMILDSVTNSVRQNVLIGTERGAVTVPPAISGQNDGLVVEARREIGIDQRLESVGQ